MNDYKDNDIKRHAMEIFRQTRKEIDPMLLLRTKQLIEQQADDTMLEGLMADKGIKENQSSGSIPIDRMKMCQIVMQYLSLKPDTGQGAPDSTSMSAMLEALLKQSKSEN